MLTIQDKSILTDFEEAERKSPCPRKIANDERTIYASRGFRRPKNLAWGYPVLCDFGEARIGGSYPYEEIQPEVYKAPEIIMQTDWPHSVDIWNTACVVSQLRSSLLNKIILLIMASPSRRPGI
jgi:serine/threonine-protein kinase SRPK3